MKHTNHIAVFVAALSLTAMVGCAGTATKESTGQFVDDTTITTKVKAAIFNDESLKATEIKVETFKGQVQLSGFVKSQADINHAVTVAQAVSGVASVKNDMLLK